MTTTDKDLTVVHLMRHGEVANPDGVLYGRLSGYHLSELGRQMADRVAEHLSSRDVTHVVASPLERRRRRPPRSPRRTAWTSPPTGGSSRPTTSSRARPSAWATGR